MTIIRNGIESADLDIPVVLPTLNLDFANSQSLDERITFSRGSIGTFVNKNGLIETAAANIPRFDYDPVTGECKGLLIEESRQNLLTYSEDFSNAVWTSSATNIINTNSTISPTGSTNGNQITNNSVSNNFNFISQQYSSSTKGSYTYSLFVKDNNISTISFLVGTDGYATNYARATYTFSSQSFSSFQYVGTPTNWVSSASSAAYPNGWYKISITFNTTNFASQSTLNVGFYPGVYGSTRLSYLKSFYVWGAQLETGAFPTSYIPTTTSAVTRSADVASMTGTNFSSWYNQSEGTIYLSLVPNYSNAVANRFKRYLSINVSPGSGQDNVIQFISIDATNQIQSALWFNSVFQAGANLTVRSGAEGKIAYSLKQNSAVLTGNGFILQNDTACILPTNMNRMDIGGYGGIGAYQSSGCYKRITYYPKALSPSQLQYLTQ